MCCKYMGWGLMRKPGEIIIYRMVTKKII